MFQKHKQERQVHFSIPSILRKQEDTALCSQIKQTLTLNNIKPAELYKFPLHIDVIKEEIDCKDFYFLSYFIIYQAVNMFICAVKLETLTWEFVDTDSHLESFKSSCTQKFII